MSTDMLFVVGLVVAAFGFPALVSAYSDSRQPRAAALAFFIGGALITWAAWQKPGGYRFENIPAVVMKVVHDLGR